MAVILTKSLNAQVLSFTICHIIIPEAWGCGKDYRIVYGKNGETCHVESVPQLSAAYSGCRQMNKEMKVA